MSAPTQTLQSPASTTTSTQPSSTTNWAPTAKVSVGILAASLTTLLLPLLSKANISPEPAQAAALTTLITFVIQYMVPER
jgi:putative flippase GtrA